MVGDGPKKHPFRLKNAGENAALPYFSSRSMASTRERMMLRRDKEPTSLPFCTTGTFLMRLAANRAHTSSTGVVASTEITR